jgi:hypothetical protein
MRLTFAFHLQRTQNLLLADSLSSALSGGPFSELEKFVSDSQTPLQGRRASGGVE